MKTTTLTVAAIGLLQLAVAQPHRRRHAHQDMHVKRDGDVVVTVVNTVYAAATQAPEVVVFVNEQGEPVSTATEAVVEYVPSTTSSVSTSSTTSSTSSTSVAPAPTPVPVVAPAVVAAVNVESSSSAPVAYVAPVAPVTPAVASPAPEAKASASSSSSSESSGYGFSYSPYNADGTCKSQTQVNTDFDSIPSGYSLVRTYGTDCNQVATVLSAAKTKGLKLFAGVFDVNALSTEISTIITAANGDWTSFDTISIGNELVNSGAASASSIVAAIGTARGLLTAAGYPGKIVTVDTLVAARANPSICDASDYCAVNCHPFFDGSTAAADSGSFLTTQIPTLRAVLSNQNQEIVITETGWPWKGGINGVAVPSVANQVAALSSIKTSFSSNPEGVILFTPFNDYWKTNTAAQFQAEQYWGFIGDSPSG